VSDLPWGHIEAYPGRTLGSLSITELESYVLEQLEKRPRFYRVAQAGVGRLRLLRALVNAADSSLWAGALPRTVRDIPPDLFAQEEPLPPALDVSHARPAKRCECDDPLCRRGRQSEAWKSAAATRRHRPAIRSGWRRSQWRINRDGLYPAGEVAPTPPHGH